MKNKKYHSNKRWSWFFLILMILQLFPAKTFALTGGPSQPEVETFQSIEVTDMVDPATGDFSYNIPLMEVGGYPINLIYNAGITMDQEASIVGLGWNINPGVISRSIRGIPDDFNGDEIEKKVNIRENSTWGVSYSGKFELFGIGMKNYTGKQISLSPSLGISYNNYDGFGLEFGITPAFSGGDKCLPGLNASMGLTASSKEGLGFSPSLSYSKKIDETKGFSTFISSGFGTNINSRAGFKTLTYNVGATSKGLGTIRGKDENGQEASLMTNSSHSFFSGSASLLNFTSTTFIPKTEYPLKNSSYTFQASVAIEGMGAFSGLSFTGYHSKQELETNYFSTPSYGIAYLDNGKDKNGLLDFNREKDGSFNKEKPNLPIPFLTHDIFSLSGQGIGGSYQLFRGDIGVIHDKKSKNFSNGNSLGVEIGAGNAFRLGGDIHTNIVNSYTGKWDEFTPTLDINIGFHKFNQGTFEPHYFKASGEASPYLLSEENVYTSTGNDKAVNFSLNKTGSEVTLMPNLKNNFGDNFPISGPILRINRAKRNQSISYLTVAEAKNIAIDKKIKTYNIDGENYTEIERDNNYRKAHHISEVTALRPDGLRYIYGIPAYNTKQYEVTFNRDPSQSADCSTGLVSYVPESSGDITPQHKFGLDHFLDQESTPAFAHSYLLTAILSEDYIDLTGDGPSPDDLGTYTKFNYSRIHDSYRWRIPYEHANFNPGFNSKTDDDKANFTYGEKEIWILHSIESKTQIARFNYGQRFDSYGVAGYMGGMDNSMSLKKLESIILYNTPDYMQNLPSQRTPIKSVHFEFDYSLCQGSLSSSSGGKLTLKKVYFKYGKSNKGKFSPYQFKYSGDLALFSPEKGINPPYNIKGYNRWGSFLNVNTKTNNDAPIDCSDEFKLTSSEYPFIPQIDIDVFNEKEYANGIAGAWALREIKLPSGGNIRVDYEADDYGYVQDKEAMQLFDIIGTSDDATLKFSSPDLPLYGGSPYNYLFFNLSSPIPLDEDQKLHVYNHYIRQVHQSGDLFFKVFTDVDNLGDYEYVLGYTEIEDWGALDANTGYIKLKNACTKDKEVAPNGVCNGALNYEANPISKAIWQFARLHLPRLVYGSPDQNVSENADDFVSVGNAFRGLFSDFATMLDGGINNHLKNKYFGKNILKGKSWIRLNNPFWNKLAGTHRVKKILISDEWTEMTNSQHQNSEYGQEYEYTRNDRIINGKSFIISSGVASYEPLIGAEDNPFRLPITYKQENKLAPDDDFYHEGPIGESFYPGANIVYSEVKIKNLQYENLKKKASGYIIHKFYTAKEFPTKVSQTTMEAYPKKTKPILKILKIKNQDFMTTSQGYAIELNDMHGKSRSKEVFNEIGTKISGLEYLYKPIYGTNANHVPLIMPDGSSQNGVLGMDYSLVADQREARNSTKGIGVNLNNDNFFLGPVPIPSFVPLPFYSSEKTRYRSVVVNKIIHRSGVLDHTTAYDLGSTVTTQNLLWDGITGEVLLTRTINEFEDPIYNFNYPAHWAYKGMQCAYQNINAAFTPTFFDNTTKEITVSSSAVFVEGDELLVNGTDKYWVKSMNGNKLLLIDFHGNPISSLPSTIKVIRSGHRNKASTSIGSIVSLISPITGTNLNINGNKQIINAGAVEFDDKRNIYCCPGYDQPCSCKGLNLKDSLSYFINSSFISMLDIASIPTVFGQMPYSSAQFMLPYLKSYGTCFNSSITASNLTYKKNFLTNPFTGETFLEIFIGTNVNSCKCSITIKVSSTSVDRIIIHSVTNHPACENCRAIAETSQYINQASGPDIVEIITAEVNSLCLPFFNHCGNCKEGFSNENNESSASGSGTDLNKINPYTTNHRGTFTPKKSYTFLAQRKSSASNTTQPNLKQDGYFTNSSGSPYFSPFWNKNVGSSTWTPNKTNWTWTAEVTKIHPNGNELESRDPLNRYSSELLGYNDQMVVAVAGNARYGDCFFEGFEDYKYTLGSRPSVNCPSKKYFEFPSIEVTKDLSKSHSGKYFLSLANNSTTATSYPLSQPCLVDSQVINPETDTTENNINCNCLNLFNPKPGKYVFSAWINASRDPLVHQFDKAKCEVILDGITNTFKASGPIIEGWQRVYGEFQIPMNSKKITVQLLADPNNWTYFDDIRIHPFDASFKSFVYDDITLRFTYELDENNYFTKYEYDDSGKLERVKKETERGVMTIQETRFSNKKTQ